MIYNFGEIMKTLRIASAALLFMTYIATPFSVLASQGQSYVRILEYKCNIKTLGYTFYYANKYKIDPKLALAVLLVESSCNPQSLGSAGERGLFQLHPRWFPKANFSLKDNISSGIKHLAYMKRHCINQRDNSWVICYNIGFKKVKRYKNHPYYKKVLEIHRKLMYNK